MKKDLLKLLDLSREDITTILNTADQLKYETKHSIHRDYLKGKTLAMIFEKNSTRTRVSFETGMFQLGGHALFLSGKESQIGRGEPVEDTARVLARYCDGIMIRTFAQAEVEALARMAPIPVVNGLTDFAHPCQVLADLMIIREYKRTFKGKKLCFIGPGSNVADSLIVGALKVGMEVAVACPDGFEPDERVLTWAETADGFSLTNDPLTAISGADAVYAGQWDAFFQKIPEKKRKKVFPNYQVNGILLRNAKPDAIVLHSLPARRGEAITAEVFEEHAGEIFAQAENRLHGQKAVLLKLLGGQ